MKMAEKEDKYKERKGMKMVRKENKYKEKKEGKKERKTLKRNKHRRKIEKLFLDSVASAISRSHRIVKP